MNNNQAFENPIDNNQINELSYKRQNERWVVFKKSKLGMISTIFLIIVVLISIFAPFIAPADPVSQYVSERMLSASSTHWLGTDAFGRDILSRIIYGSRTSLLVGFIAVIISSLIGTILGTSAGYIGGKFDDIVMRILDSLMAIPMLLMGLMFLIAFGSNVTTVIIAISVGLIPSSARIARGPTMEIKEKEFVKAAIASGTSTPRIILLHILPNIIGSVLVLATLHMSSAIRVEASLSFLGLGVQPPIPTWGNMIKDGLDVITVAPGLAIFPGIALMLVVIAFNLFGDTLRDAMDPHVIRQRS